MGAPGNPITGSERLTVSTRRTTRCCSCTTLQTAPYRDSVTRRMITVASVSGCAFLGGNVRSLTHPSADQQLSSQSLGRPATRGDGRYDARPHPVVECPWLNCLSDSQVTYLQMCVTVNQT